MVPVADGRRAFGFIPDDVNDNDGNFDVASPFQDLEEVSHTVNEAVIELYELGVASGLSNVTYGPEHRHVPGGDGGVHGGDSGPFQSAPKRRAGAGDTH